MSFPASGATYSLADNLTASDTLSIAGAAFSVNGKVLTVSSTLTLSSGSLSIGSGSISGYTMAHSGGTVNLNTGTLTLTTAFSQTGGTLNFNSGSITCGTWSSSGTRTIDWNTTGTVYVTGNSISHSATNLTTTNAPGAFSHSGSSLGTLNIGTFTESTAPNLTAQGSTTWAASPTQTVKNFTHLPVGTISGGSPTVYGDLTLSYGTLSSGSVITLAATSGTKTITTNGGSLYSLVISGPGATYNLVGDITFYSFQLSQGTFSAGSYNITATSFTNSSSSTRTLNMGSGTWSIGGDWNPNATGLTFSAQTSTINLTSTSSINFVGGGRTYYNLNKADTGSLTISGSNTFNAISSSATGAATISFTAGTTQTVSGFTASGTAGNLLTLQSTTSGSKWYLSKSSGTVSVGYLSISDCTVNPGANWYAGRNSTNGGNNLGWFFSDPYVVAGQFLDVISFSDE